MRDAKNERSESKGEALMNLNVFHGNFIFIIKIKYSDNFDFALFIYYLNWSFI
jgi:hypothetical protein